MRDESWYRRTTWTDRDRDEFNGRLKRSRRAGNKAQYLRIQALYLAQAGLHNAAIELLDRVVTEFPESIEVAQAHFQNAESLARLGQIEGAVNEFRATLQSERDFPNIKTQAWLEYPWFIVEQQLTARYAEALDILDEFLDQSALTFPVDRYRYFAVLAVISAEHGDQATARRFALEALTAAAKQHSGLRNHPTVGLVGCQSSRIDTVLRLLTVQT